MYGIAVPWSHGRNALGGGGGRRNKKRDRGDKKKLTISQETPGAGTMNCFVCFIWKYYCSRRADRWIHGGFIVRAKKDVEKTGDGNHKPHAVGTGESRN